ncbi:hypothetical protein PC119_g20259 [Phytophthora cactorum]|uniref:Uncharacterized protein n=1 Tax=Phytophthora cactorum TaxID=29920 RepID=A0A8T1B4C5_9STRA|nr:hypothetical protein PC115_g18429 [Phytophthora cactorum]KAG2984978.1 hypothetical protein PC119_g20259 [Phytophthora cactorum]KAG4043611.1 hypothetical protein PC123_g20922 [Phytophthora cactorum]
MVISGTATASERSAADTTWLLPHTLSGDPNSNGRYAPSLPSSSICDFHKWRMLWQLVMMDYERVVLIGWLGSFVDIQHGAILKSGPSGSLLFQTKHVLYLRVLTLEAQVRVSEHSVHTTHHGAAHYSRHGRPIAYGFRGSPSHADRSIAEDGVVPRWRDQDSRTGVRHVPSAVEGTENEPDLSAPRGASVNGTTDTEWMTDTQWDPFYTIAQRVIELRSRYAGHPTYAFAQSFGRLKLSVNRERFRTIAKQTNCLRRAAINDSTLATYAKKFRHWTKYL